MADLSAVTGGSVVGLKQVPRDEVCNYGVIDPVGEHVGAGDDGEERESLGVAGEVSCEALGVEGEACGEQDDEHRERAGGHDVQAVGQPVDLLLFSADSDDAGSHDEREVAGEQSGDGVDACRWFGGLAGGVGHGRR